MYIYYLCDFLLLMLLVFIFYYCCNKLPQTKKLKNKQDIALRSEDTWEYWRKRDNGINNEGQRKPP